MQFTPFTLENWFREHYFDSEIVLCVSGVEEFSLGELRTLVHLSQEEMDCIVFKDSPSYGSLALREAIARRWRQGNAEQVMVTHGSSEAIFLVMTALLRPGDEIVVLSPCYQALFSIPEAIGCTVRHWKLRPEQQFIPDIEELKRLLSPQTRMVVVNVPNNPTGSILTQEQQQELIALVEKNNAYLLWDSAFTQLSYDTPPLPDPGLQYERTITLGTLTKTYGLSGLRVGWCLASPDVLKKCIGVRDYITLNLSPLVEHIALRVVENIDILRDIRFRQACINRDILTEWITSHSEHVDWTRPQGGVSTFLKFTGVADVEMFCRDFAKKYSVFLLPGACFGYPEFVRLGFGGATKELQEGLTRLSLFLNSRKVFQSSRGVAGQ